MTHAIFFVRDLNRLVMDYLVIEGYKSAAEEFSMESGVQPAVDFASIESRRNIREALNRGDVQEAITRVNDLNPEVNQLSYLVYRIKHSMHHSQPIAGGDDCAKPSVFKMIYSISCPAA
jgi:LisH